MENKLQVSTSPHIWGGISVAKVMQYVILALMPAAIMSVYYFGFRSLLVMLVAVGSSVLFEYLWCKLTKRENTIGDYSAAVTGLILAMNLPPTIPYYMVVVGSFVAIVVAKEFFGGLGHNFINPALAGRAFLMASWLSEMTKWAQPRTRLPLFGKVDTISQVTPLAQLKAGEAVDISYLEMFFGNVGGCIGETCAAALLIGGLFLIYKRIITPIIPFTYIATVGLMSYIFSPSGFFKGDPWANILSGGLFLAAFFMATDYVTSPSTFKGQFIMGIFMGVITVIIRVYGGYPEGASYAVMLMNILTPLVEKATMPRIYGTKKQAGGKAQ
ncbi:MAG: RnfABCDGE type electron transport complex subunit D [Clostridiaceae bacterium]|nr:RnfABCDGE type electron transport complex subunit D [Clostridiaceae bacterium]